MKNQKPTFNRFRVRPRKIGCDCGSAPLAGNGDEGDEALSAAARNGSLQTPIDGCILPLCFLGLVALTKGTALTCGTWQTPANAERDDVLERQRCLGATLPSQT